MSPVTRELIEFVCPEQLDARPLRLSLAPEPIPGKPLAGDAEAGDGAVLLELPAGWSGGGGTTGHAFELVVLEGAIEVDGEPIGRYGYLASPIGARCPALGSSEGASVFVDFIADVTESAVEPPREDGWHERPRDDGPAPAPGLTRKILRGAPDTARSFFLRIPPGWQEDRTEWHDCAEAALQLEGDLWHVRANGGAGGTMTRHCYFWRPPRVLHSPMGSEGGAFMFVTVDDRLVNHFVEEEGPPPAE